MFNGDYNIMEKYELWKKGKFMVCPIVRLLGVSEPDHNLITQHLDVKEGLAIECKSTGDSYVVIALVKPDKDNEFYYKSIGSRIEDFCTSWEDVLVFREALKFSYSKMLEEQQYE